MALLAAACAGREAGPRWLKGQTHVHSGNSGDSRTPPEEVARWYAARGYDFIVLTDHNRVTRLPPGPAGALLVLPGVELTQNLETCDPAPEPGLPCLLHVNALVLAEPRADHPPWRPTGSPRRVDLYRSAIDEAHRLGGIAQINHPNLAFGAADPALLAELARHGAALVEIANMAFDSLNQGDAAHPSVEALWDAALTQGVTLWGVASDDAHHYADAEAARARGEPVFTGDRGFVMVRARREAAAIRAALARGEFYSSTGVLLERAEAAGGALVVAVAAGSPGPHRFTFVGPGGKVLAEADGREARFELAAAPAPGYVRAVVTDGTGRKAWVQPVPAR